MGHHCCSKQKVKRGLWSPEEDEKLINFITTHGHGCWSTVPKQAGLQRCGKSCRLRWINYLRPDLKRGSFTALEERIIIDVHRILGNRWAQIAKHLPGRTDNEVKNFWNSCIKKKLIAQGLDPKTHNLLPSSCNNSFHSSQFQHSQTLPPPFTISSSIKNSDAAAIRKTSMDINPAPPPPPPITLHPTSNSPHEATTLLPNFQYQDPNVLMSFKDQNFNVPAEFATRPSTSFDHEQVSSSFNPLAFMDEASMWTTTGVEPAEFYKEKGVEQPMACKMDFNETIIERNQVMDNSYHNTSFDLDLMDSALMPCGVFCNASSMEQLEWNC